MTHDSFDIVVIGGGINGAGIAADAAGRGARVLLAEADDLGGATSSASSKLIHGGLRYLEHYEFKLVRQALAEREVLLAMAPHISWPLRFVLPQMPGMRSGLMLRAGLFLYDHLARRVTLPGSRAVNLMCDAAGQPLAASLTRGFSYWDGWVDDARLVVLNALAAHRRGAEVLTRTPVTGIRPIVGPDGAPLWQVTLSGARGAGAPGSGSPGTGSAAASVSAANGLTAGTRTVVCRALVNAAGPWVQQVAELAAGGHSGAEAGPEVPRLRLVKGSHIVVPRIAGAGDAYLFQNPDGRVVFALPFEDAFTLIGTTDEPYAGDPRAARASAAEVAYLLDLANRVFKSPLTAADVVWSYAGVRPLIEDGSDQAASVSRDYRLDLVAAEAGGPPRAPLLNVVGGKITTYRRLSEKALDKLRPHLPGLGPAWTADSVLPGGDLGQDGFEAWLSGLCALKPGFSEASLHTLARRYGTRVLELLGAAQNAADLGDDLGGGLSAREVVYLQETEWATTADDVIWRRTKAALHVPPDARTALAARVSAVLARRTAR